MSGFSGEPLGGRFWAIASDSDEDDEVVDDLSSAAESPFPARLSTSSFSYVCRSPEPTACDLPRMSTIAMMRKEKKRRLQREMSGVLGMISASPKLPSIVDSIVRSPPAMKEPVIPPSTFLLETFDAKEWVLVQRRRNLRVASRGKRGSLPMCSSVNRQTSVQTSMCSSIDRRKSSNVIFSPNHEMGHVGHNTREKRTFSKEQMGSELAFHPLVQITSSIRLTGGFCRLLGLSSRRVFHPAPIVSPSIAEAAAGLVAMANRGGGSNPNRGRGQAGGGGRGNGAGRWNGGAGFGPGRGNNYYEGSSSGTAGQDEGYNRGSDDQGGGFDGVFRAGPSNYEGGRPRFNNGSGYHRGPDRRNFGGQGNYNFRRANNGYNTREVSNRSTFIARNSVTDSGGLTEQQSLLVKETASALAKQLAEMSKQGGQSGPAVQPPIVLTANQPTAATREGLGSRRAEETLLAVAGITPQAVGVTANLEGTCEAQMAKKKKGSGCFRCGQPGHCLNDCTEMICDCCQSTEHISRMCPLLTAPKPHMIMYGLAHEELMFWDVPMSVNVRPRLENTRLGRVTISGGQLSIQEIIVQLQWIVPDDSYEWDVVRVEDNVYRVNFPSKMDLVRVQHFGRFNVPNSEIFMTFDFWKKSVEPIWRAQDVWVRVYDLPTSVLDDFLALWALGNLFGKTRDIDMVFTRANDVLRILITCLDPSLIPANMDIRVLDDFYRFRFEVEGLQAAPLADIVMNDANNGEGDMEHDGQNGNTEHTDDQFGTSENTQDGMADEGGKSTSVQGQTLAISPIKFGVAGFEKIVNGEVWSCVPKSANVTFSTCIDETLKDTCARLFDTPVSVENDEQLQGAKLSVDAAPYLSAVVDNSDIGIIAEDYSRAQPNIHGFTPTKDQSLIGGVSDDNVSSPLLTGSTPVGLQKGLGEYTDECMSSPLISVSTPVGIQKGLGESTVARVSSPMLSVSTPVGVQKGLGESSIYKPTMSEVINFGGIQPSSAMGMRSSDRLRAQPNADATQMERAMMIAEKRDDFQTQGYTACGVLDPTMGFPSSGGSAGDYRYWVQPSADGYSGLLFPGYWVATH